MNYPIKFSPLDIITIVNFYKRLDRNEGLIVGPFLCSSSPKTHIDDFENAIDFLCPSGTEVLAINDGEIISLEDSFNGFGGNKQYEDKVNYVVIEHEGNCRSYYLHLEVGSVTNRGLKVGDKVKKGQIIGNVDNNGYMLYDPKKGPITHLHFELRKKAGSTYKSMNPKFENSFMYLITGWVMKKIFRGQ